MLLVNEEEDNRGEREREDDKAAEEKEIDSEETGEEETKDRKTEEGEGSSAWMREKGKAKSADGGGGRDF